MENKTEKMENVPFIEAVQIEREEITALEVMLGIKPLDEVKNHESELVQKAVEFRKEWLQNGRN